MIKSKFKNIDKCNKLFEVEISSEKAKQALDDVYKEVKKTATIPGFRQGQAPRDMLEKYHGHYAKDQMLKILIPEACRKAFLDHKTNPATMPDIFDVQFGKDNNILFKAKVETYPDLKLKNYKGIKIKLTDVSVSDGEVQDELERLRNMHANFEPVKEKRPVKIDDYTICDVEAFHDQKPITKKHENMWIQASKDASMLGLGEKLVGMEIGQTKEVSAKLPENYPDKKYAGLDAMFKINLKEIKEKKLPGLDDSFAKDLKKDSLNALKESLKEQLKTKKESGFKIENENQILEKLLKDNKFDVPQSMIKRQHEILMKQAEEKLLQSGMHKSQVEEKKKALEESLLKDAENKIKIYFILDKVAGNEKLSINDDDLNKRFKDISAMTNQPEKEVKDYYQKNGFIEGLKEQLSEEKALNWLLDQSQKS